MMPDPLFYPLVLMGLLWLCLLLHVVWPYNRATSGPATLLSANGSRAKRS
jgi:hypothetical protein